MSDRDGGAAGQPETDRSWQPSRITGGEKGEMKEFTIKPEHLKLLKRAYVEWAACEFGAPAIDCKRPYGNSDVINDMIEILFGQLPEDVVERLSESRGDYLRDLHRDTKRALQICLRTGQFEAGIYQADDYTEKWTKKTT